MLQKLTVVRHELLHREVLTVHLAVRLQHSALTLGIQQHGDAEKSIGGRCSRACTRIEAYVCSENSLLRISGAHSRAKHRGERISIVCIAFVGLVWSTQAIGDSNREMKS